MGTRSANFASGRKFPRCHTLAEWRFRLKYISGLRQARWRYRDPHSPLPSLWRFRSNSPEPGSLEARHLPSSYSPGRRRAGTSSPLNATRFVKLPYSIAAIRHTARYHGRRSGRLAAQVPRGFIQSLSWPRARRLDALRWGGADRWTEARTDIHWRIGTGPHKPIRRWRRARTCLVKWRAETRPSHNPAVSAPGPSPFQWKQPCASDLRVT